MQTRLITAPASVGYNKIIRDSASVLFLSIKQMSCTVLSSAFQDSAQKDPDHIQKCTACK